MARKRHRKSSHRKSHRKSHRRAKVVVLQNPRHRRRHRKSYASNPRHRRRRSYRRNPAPPLIPTAGFLTEIAYVATGFYGTKMTAGFVLPMIGVQQPLVRILTKGVIAWGLATVGGMMLGRSAQSSLLIGGALETAQDAIRTYVSPFVPALAAADMEQLSAYYQLSDGGVTEHSTAAYYTGMGAALPSADDYTQ